MRARVLELGVLALAAAGCGSNPGPADLQGPLAFSVVIVSESSATMTGEGAPDGGWPGIDLDLQNFCYTTDGLSFPEMKAVSLQIWNTDGGPLAPGTRPLTDPNGDSSSGSAFLYYRGDAGPGWGVGGSVTLTQAGPAYVGSFSTTVSGTSLSGSFSTAAPNLCACTTSSGGVRLCPIWGN
jgi:hypothetical protein